MLPQFLTNYLKKFWIFVCFRGLKLVGAPVDAGNASAGRHQLDRALLVLICYRLFDLNACTGASILKRTLVFEQ
jgi:hypothetical protein